VDATRDLFAKHHLRCTQQRVAVYDALANTKSHPTAEEIFRLVKPRVAKLSLATVYNVLDALVAADLVQRMPTTNGCCRYDADTSPHLHVRYHDTSEIEDVPAELSAKLKDRLPGEVLEEIEDALGMEIDGISIQFLAQRRKNRAGSDR
jgi:Fe2+ or Zn2+ uptake regulation protein